MFYLILGSLLLFTIGGLGAWYAYGEYMKKSSTPVIVVPSNRFVSTNSQIELKPTTLSREALINAISDAAKDTPEGELKHLTLNLSTDKFLETLGSRAPSNLIRAFDPLFMIGVFGRSNFLIIKLESFENAFAGMLAWEEDMRTDIGPIFATAERLRSAPPETTFTDITDKNKDIRTFSPDGEPILLYSFFDNSLLIITDNIETMRVLVDHMTREKLSR